MLLPAFGARVRGLLESHRNWQAGGQPSQTGRRGPLPINQDSLTVLQDPNPARATVAPMIGKPLSQPAPGSLRPSPTQSRVRVTAHPHHSTLQAIPGTE